MQQLLNGDVFVVAAVGSASRVTELKFFIFFVELLDTGTDFLAQLFNFFLAVDVFRDKNKFIATEASDKVFVWYSLTQQFGKAVNHQIAFVVTERVVDFFEVVKVKHSADGWLLQRGLRGRHVFAFVFVGQPCRKVDVNFFGQLQRRLLESQLAAFAEHVVDDEAADNTVSTTAMMMLSSTLRRKNCLSDGSDMA